MGSSILRQIILLKKTINESNFIFLKLSNVCAIKQAIKINVVSQYGGSAPLSSPWGRPQSFHNI